eukprot:TRINITY_DN1733_c0_g1_i1.p1 TRINITY_DN1733_c0_g1~~TRINITY_DN1733_c0_g1_i1.p1  ORF type:complete len:265 (-),score=42.58 TRINITY_DN1733_c0_g1_i1:251-1045(-)
MLRVDYKQNPEFVPAIITKFVSGHLIKEPISKAELLENQSKDIMEKWRSVPDIVDCISLVVYRALLFNASIPKKYDPVWYLLDNLSLKIQSTPNSIHSLIMDIFIAGDLCFEVGVMCLVYIDRLLVLTGLTLNQFTWKKLVLGCLNLASKVWDDAAVWNEDFLYAVPGITIQDLHMVEHQLLEDLKFDVGISQKVYGKYLSEIRTMVKTGRRIYRDSTDTENPLVDELGCILEGKIPKRRHSCPTVPVSSEGSIHLSFTSYEML